MLLISKTEISKSGSTKGRYMRQSVLKHVKIYRGLIFSVCAIITIGYGQSNNLIVKKNGNLRKGPSTEASIVAKLNPEQILTILDQNGDWYLVQTDKNQTGWVNTIIVEPLSISESVNFTRDKLKSAQQQWSQEINRSDSTHITWEKLTVLQPGKLYAKPETESKILDDLPEGKSIHKLDAEGSWFYIQADDNQFGWVKQEIFNSARATPTITIKNPITLSKNGNLRQAPTTSSKKIALIPAGTTVERLDSTADWFHIRTAEETEGWLNRLVFQKSPTADSVQFLREDIVARNGNVRQQPSIEAPVIAKLRAGQTVRILIETGDWKKIQLTSEQTGWIHKILFEKSAEKPVEVSPQITSKGTRQKSPETIQDTTSKASAVTDTAQKSNVFRDELASAEEYHANRNIVKAVDNYFSAEPKLAKSSAASPKDICLKFRLAKCRYALAHSLYTKEDRTLNEALANVRNAAFSNVSCADEARQVLALWENALRMRSQVLSIFSLDSVNLKNLTKSLTATPGQLPILYEAEAKYLIGRYYLSRLNDPIEAIVWLDESVSLYKAYDRNRSVTPDSNLENYFKACLDLGVAYSQISKFGESSSAFNLAYRIARRTNNQEWLQYYQKIIRAITDRMD